MWVEERKTDTTSLLGIAKVKENVCHSLVLDVKDVKEKMLAVQVVVGVVVGGGASGVQLQSAVKTLRRCILFCAGVRRHCSPF